MFRKKRAAPASLVGLELDPSHLAAADVHVNGGLTVRRGAVAPLRPDILRDGELSDPEALVEALRELFAESGLPTRVRLGLAHQRIVVRAIDLPVLEDEKALQAAVEATAPDHIPMPMQEAVVDFQSLGRVDTPAGPRTRVVVVAVRRELIERIVAATSEAGLQVEGVDLSAFAMVRALPPVAGEESVLCVALAGLTNVAVATEQGCPFTRASSGGLDAIVTGLAERSSLTLEHARQWMAHVGLVAPLGTLDGDPAVVAAARQALEDGVEAVADSVRNSLNFHQTQLNARPVSRAVLTGPAVAIPGFAERLGEALGLPMEPAVVAAEEDGEPPARLESLTVAAGLAVDSRP